LNHSNLFVIPEPVNNPKIRLFCFPYAGGSHTIYTPWLGQFKDCIELVFIQLPGRGSRLIETPHNNMASIIDELMEHADYITNILYMLFGHSLGSRIAFDLAYNLHNENYPLPEYFIGSGSRAPHLKDEKKSIHSLPNEQFIVELDKMNGTDKRILQNEELVNLLTPMLRADFKIAELHQAPKIAISVPFTILQGSDDIDITPAQLNAWSELSQAEISIVHLPGDHFFINHHSSLVINQVNRILDNILNILD
jgi:surfactin synthase thioesterase subunit